MARRILHFNMNSVEYQYKIMIYVFIIQVTILAFISFRLFEIQQLHSVEISQLLTVFNNFKCFSP
jgi:hypothetical protein